MQIWWTSCLLRVYLLYHYLLLSATSLNRQLLCQVTHHSSPVKMTIPCGNSEEKTFHLYHSDLHPVVLGYPWLARHNPQFNWTSGSVIRWSNVCKGSWIPEVSASVCVATSTLKDDLDLSKIPQCYHDLKDVFSKACATSLPPHQTYDFAIDLLLGTAPPTGGYIHYLVQRWQPCRNISRHH